MKSNTQIKLWAMTLIAVLMCVNLLTLGVNGSVLALVVAAIAGLAGIETGRLMPKVYQNLLARVNQLIPVVLPQIPEPYRSEIEELLEKLKTEG